MLILCCYAVSFVPDAPKGDILFFAERLHAPSTLKPTHDKVHWNGHPNLEASDKLTPSERIAIADASVHREPLAIHTSASSFCALLRLSISFDRMYVILGMLFFHLKIAFVKWSSWKWLENMYTCLHVFMYPLMTSAGSIQVVKDQDAPSRFKQESTMEDVSECHHILFVIDKSYGI